MKKLLMALAACATTLLASAAIKTSEGFEGDDLGNFSGTGGSLATYDTAPAITNYPFADAGDKYCEIDADSTDTLASAQVEGATYFDMYVQFPANASVPSIDDLDENAKLAVYVNESTNLAVVAGDGNGATVTNVTDTTITPGTWARLTIAKVTDGYMVYVNGEPVQRGAFTAITSGDPSTVAFTGCGKLDNFVARTTDPFIQNPAATIGGEGYASLADAIADGNGTPQLEADASYTIAARGGSVSVKLNNHTLDVTAPEGLYAYATTSGDVTTYTADYFPRTATAGQDGSAANPFEIADEDDLLALQAAVAADVGRGLCYVQTADIALTAAWEGIGVKGGKDIVTEAAYDNGAFTGVYDGGNYTISNFVMENGTDYGALFNSIYQATVKNLKLSWGSSTLCANASSSGGDTGASFVGVAKESTLQNLTAVAGTVTTVSASKDMGGIVGYLMAGSTVDSCTNELNIASLINTKRKCGGIAIITQGGSGSAIIRNCKNSGTITAASKGGLVGYIGVATEIDGCENTAAVQLVHFQSGSVTASGVNKGNATVASNDKSGGVTNLYFATVSGDVATFVADNALVADETYKVMSAGATATYAFAAAGTIAFDTTLYTPTYAVTADEALILSDATENNIKTYTAGQAVAQVGDTKYASFQAAFDAAIASGSVVTFLSNLGETVTLDIAPGTVTIVFNPNGYSFTTPDPFAGADGVSLGAPTAVGDGTYTIVATRKKTSTWTGTAGDGLWATVENWSTGEVPDADTIVTLPDGAEIGVTGTSAIPVDSIVVNGAVALSCTGSLANNWPSIGIKGGVSGSGTLTLNRVGLASSDGDEVIVDCGIYFDGKGYDSFIDGGSFVFNGAFSGTGKFVLLSGATFNGAVTLPSGATLSVGRNGTYPNAPIFGDNSTLTGDGTIALWCNGYDARSVFDSVRNKLTNQAWTGVCELSGTMAHIDFGKYGNVGSTVRPNGLSGYLRFSAGSTTQIAVGIKALDIGSNGFTMNNQFSNGDPCNYQFDAPLTGSGTITFGTKHQNDGVQKSFYTFTGDVSGFTGVVTFGAQSYRPVVVFKAGNDEVADPTDWGQIIVTENKTVNVGAAWNSVGGYLIYGTASVSESGSLVCGAGTQKIAGDGVIRYAAVPATAPQLNGWEGTVVLGTIDAGSTAKEIPLNQWGTASSKITLEGVAGNAYCASSNFTVEAALTLAGDVNFQNGSSYKTVIFRKIAAGTGNLSLKTWYGCNGITYGFTTLDADNYTGTIQLDGEKMTFKVGDILKVGAAAGDKVLNLTVANNATVNLSDATLNGEAANFELKEDGIYVAAGGFTPSEGDTEVAVTIADAGMSPEQIEAAVIEAAAAMVTVPSAQGVEPVSGATYLGYFNTSVTGENGAYTLTLDGLKDEVYEEAKTDAIEALLDSDTDTIDIPAGLYYKITPSADLTTWGTAAAGLSTGTVDAPVTGGTGKGFYKVELSATPIK